MSENAKTMAFVGIGMAALVVALVARPSAARLNKEDLVGVNLTKKFTNPDDAKRIKIIKFNEDTATLREFEAGEGPGGLWTMPSKDGYPADAKQQMSQASMSLKDCNILFVQSEDRADHELYGVIEPSTALKPGQKGVGARVTLLDSNNDPLVDLIIGKERKESEGQYYVREVGRDVVYVIKIDPTKLSTQFEDWIEKDLLKLDAWDLSQIEVKDYSVELVADVGPNGQLVPVIDWNRRADMTLAYNDKDAKWEALKLQSYDPKKKQYVDFTITEDEELNTTSLNDLKSALDDLKIVDVVRKPKGLSEDLKAGDDFLNNVEARRDLILRGFLATSDPSGQNMEFISSDGEVIATLKNGAEYVLRFGNLNTGAEGEQGKPAGEGKPEDKGSAHSDVHRYLFVMARMNEAAVKQPELQTLPDLPPDAAAAADAKPEGEADAAAATDAAKQEPAAGEEKQKTETDKPADAAAQTDTKDAATDTKDAVDKPENPKEESAEAGKEGSDKENKQKEVARIMAERKRIEDENQRKQAEYQDTLKAGHEKVKELNLRFGDWYFVVDNDVFNKLRLGREGVVKKKGAKEGANQVSPPGGLPGALPGGGIPGLPPIPGAGS